MNERDEIGSTQPNENAVLISSLVFSVFENASSYKNTMKTSSQVAYLSSVGSNS